MLKKTSFACALPICFCALALLCGPVFAAPSADGAEQSELSKVTAENNLADQKLRLKLQRFQEEKEEIRAKYELLMQQQKMSLADLNAALERLNIENKLNDEKISSAVKALRIELETASMNNRLADEKRRAQLQLLDNDYQKLTGQNKLQDEQAKARLFKLNEDLARISLENKVAAESSRKGIAELAAQFDKLKVDNDLKNEKLRSANLDNDREKARIDLEMRKLDLKERQLRYEKLAMDSRMDKLKSDLELRAKKEEWKTQSNTEPVYMDNPFRAGKLVISDRRIALNGPIFFGVSDEITERIHYYNNISSAPIFLVIDRCPGGSVMEGYRIVKAMQASRAPVYVVVKSFAASMAAVITTLADQSYVYPNAIVLHHQMSTIAWGNMTQLKEQLELAKEWERRLHVPVAKKMGISPEAFRKKMYEKNSDGDWEEFGDKAVEYKWATSVVNEIDETGFTKNPDAVLAYPPSAPKPQRFQMVERTDEKGQRYVQLPRLDPCDFYFIYNPDRYYR